MKLRFGSIDWKFPAFMSGLTLVTTGLFIWAAYGQFTTALLESAGERLRTGAAFIASNVGGPTPQRREATSSVVDNPSVKEFLRSGSQRSTADSLLSSLIVRNHDVDRIGVQIVGISGDVRLFHSAPNMESWATWGLGFIRSGEASADESAYGPFEVADSRPVYQVVTPVTALADVAASDSILGYLVETHATMGLELSDPIRLLGASLFLVGVPGEGVWTDLVSAQAEPLRIPRADTILILGQSSAQPGVGVAQSVPGTPWFVWLQVPRAAAIAPASGFVIRFVPVAAAIAIMGALFVWLLSRQITNRLVALTDEVNRMEYGQGQPQPPTDDDSDEIERLGHAFERLAARVEKQQKIEQQLMQSQKIEAVGRLAGGIAHDFNNVLTVVRNYSELVRTELPKESEVARDMEEVLHATERASGLTRQLLSFSRQQVIAPQEIDLNETIRSSQRMMQRVLPSHVVLETELNQSISHIMADKGQIEQVLLNLMLNAADAMPSGGRIIVRSNMTLRDDDIGRTSDVGRTSSDPSMYVRLTVEDTGTGMDRATRERVFEPFFTTKAVGKGTGLGLATVHGIVTQSDGRIVVDSEPGKGTIFNIYFPAIKTEEPEAASQSLRNSSDEFPASSDGAAKRTILVVEDDPSTREVTRRLLKRHGYLILEAENAASALAILGDGDAKVDLVLTDVMMPGMSGVDLAARIGDRWPRMPVLLMSGYSDSEIRTKGALGRQRSLVEKPFTASRLLKAVQAAISES